MRIQYYLTLLCLCLLATSNITAQLTQWTGLANDNNWFTAGNWNNGLPATGNNALIGGGATVVIGSPLTVSYTITNFGSISVDAALTNNGSIDNSNTLTFSTTSSLMNNANLISPLGSTMSFSGAAAFTNGVGATFNNGGSFTLQTILVNLGSVINNGTIDATNGTLQSQGSFNNNQTLTTKSLSIAAGSSFINDFGSTLNITGAGAILQISGTLTNNGIVNNAGAATVAGTLNNNVNFNNLTGGILTVNVAAQLNSAGTVTNNGAFINNGSVTNANQFINAGTADNFNTFNNNFTLNNLTGATFTNRTSATISQGFGSSIQNAGTFTNQSIISSFGALNNDGTFSNTGTITMFNGAAFDNNTGFTNNGTISFNNAARNDGSLTNNGTMNVNSGVVLSNFGTFLNSTTGTLTNNQDILNKTGATFTNNGIVQNFKNLLVEGGTLTNNAYLRNADLITVQAGGTLTNNELLFLNAGNLKNQGSIINTKKLLVDDCSSINNTGNINNTGGTFELHGIFFQTGSPVSGNPVNVQGGYIHTSPTSNAPVACQNGTFGADINGQVKVYASELVSFSTFDSCSNIVYLANGEARPVFTCAQIGIVQSVNLSIKTNLNDELTCVALVTPVDLLAPVFTNCPRDIIVFTPNATVPASWTVPTATDNCTTVNVTSTHTPGSSFPVGITGVTYNATDTHGNLNNCQFRVDVRKTPPGGSCTGDATPPVITGCPSNITTTAIGQSAVLTWTPPNVSDNCYPITLSSTAQPGQAFFPGTTPVIYTAKDGNNNTSTCTFTVTVGVTNFCLGDTQKPYFVNCPANIYAPTNPVISGAVIVWNAPSAFDLCGVASVTASHVIGSVFPTGTTNVTYTALDAAGNSATCNFVVTVGADPCPGDLTAPTFSSCPTNVNVTSSGATGVATWTVPGASDPCGPVTVNATHLPGSTFPVGTSQVIYKASDRKGNMATCAFNVTINNACSIDNVNPVIAGCPANITVPSSTGSAPATWTLPTATDNCGLTYFAAPYLPGAFFPAGSTTVIYAALDAKGNAANCQFTVTVTPPPGCTTNSLPAANATNVNPASVSLSWASAPGATSYDVLFGTVNPPTTLIANVSGNTATVTNLLGGTDYYFYVVPKNAAGSATGCAGSTTKFTTQSIVCTGCAGNILTNGCFENGLKDFTSVSAALTNSAAAGFWAVDVTGGTGKVEISKPAAAGTAYTFKASSKISNTNQCGTMFMRFKNAAGTVLATFSASVTATAYTLYTVTGTAPVGTTQVTISGEKCGNGGTLTTDEWCLTGISNSTLTITCPANITVNSAPGSTGAVVTYANATATSTCTVGTVTVTKTSGLNSGSNFPVGTSQVCFTATDGCGNTQNCCFNIIVNSALTIACPANVTVSAVPGATGAVATYANPTTSNNCLTGTVTLTRTSGLASGSTFPVGTTQVCYTATNGCGATASCCFNVVVNATASTLNIACPANINVTAPSGASSAVVTFSNPTATTNCTTGSITYSQTFGSPSGSTFPIGTSQVCFSATDGCFTTQSCCFNIVVQPGTASCNKTALYVVGNTSLNTSDAAIKSRLESLGYIVTVKDDDVAVSADATGKGLVYISPSVDKGKVNTKFTNVTVPVINNKHDLFDDLKMTGTVKDVDFGKTNGVSQITIQAPSHPMAAGLTGTVTVFSPAGNITWGKPGTAAVKIGYVPGVSDHSMIFGYETGVTMVGLIAPARRVGFYFQNNYAQTQTAAGWALFDATIFWATMCPPCTPAPVANCQNITRQQAAAGQSVQITGAEVNNGSTAGCAGTITSMNASPTSFSAPGTYTVTLTVTNSLGLSSTCTATVTILAPPAAFDPAKCYKIIAKHSGKALTVKGGSTANGAFVVQNTYTGTAQQQWHLESDGAGFYKLKAQHSGKYLNLVGSPPFADGVLAEQNAFASVDDFFWKVESDGAGYYRFKLKNNLTKVLDVTGSSLNEDASVILWTLHTGDNQRWQIVEVPCASVCSNITNGGTIAKSCSNGQVSLTNSTLPSGGAGTIEYLWISGTTDCNVANMSAVPGANATTLTVSNPGVTTYYIRCSRRSGCTTWDGESNCVTVQPNECSCPGNLLLNSGFENNYTGWAWVDAPATTTTTGVFAGTKSGIVCTDEGGAGNQTTIVPGATLTLKAWAKVSGTPSWACIGMTFYDANWVQIGPEIKTGVTATAWTQYTVTAIAPQSAKYVDCWFWKNNNGCLYVDDFCLTQNTSTACNNTILFVVGNDDALNSGDTWVKNRLTSLGMNVDVEDDDEVTTSDATGKGLVLISSTTNSGSVNTKFTNVAVPVVTWESYLLDDLKMTGTVAETDYGSYFNNSLTIADVTHPLAAGLSGTVQVYAANQTMQWGKTSSASAAKVAKIAGQANYGIFAFPQGAAMPGGINAPHRRASLFLHDLTGPLLNANGIKLFDAAIEWATNCNVLLFGGSSEVVEGREKEAGEGTKPAGQPGILVYPNPAQSEIFVQLPEFEGRETLIRMFDASGRLVRELETTVTGEPIQINVAELFSGQYLLWMLPKGERQAVSKKFMVERQP